MSNDIGYKCILNKDIYQIYVRLMFIIDISNIKIRNWFNNIIIDVI